MGENDLLSGYMMGQNEGCKNGGLFGGDGIVGLIAILALLGGGMGGFGFGGGGMMWPWMMMGGGFGGWNRGDCATQADLAAGFNNSAVLNNLNDLKLGQAGIQQTMCQGFNGVNTTMLQGFNGVERGFCDLSHQISDCCCTTQRAIDGVNYNLATQACDTRRAIEDGTRAILDRIAQSDYNQLKEKYDAAQIQLMLGNQNRYFDAALDSTKAEILRRTGNDCPVNAVVVQPPTPVRFNQGCGNFGTGYAA
jgi:hypothetical protein